MLRHLLGHKEVDLLPERLSVSSLLAIGLFMLAGRTVNLSLGNSNQLI